MKMGNVYRGAGVASAAFLASLAVACGGDGNGDVSKITPNATNTRPAVMRTYTPETSETPSAKNYSIGISPNISGDGWQWIREPPRCGDKLEQSQVDEIGRYLGRQLFSETINVSYDSTSRETTIRINGEPLRTIYGELPSDSPFQKYTSSNCQGK